MKDRKAINIKSDVRDNMLSDVRDNMLPDVRDNMLSDVRSSICEMSPAGHEHRFACDQLL